MEKEGIGRALLATVREWIGGLGCVGALFAGVYLVAADKLPGTPSVIGLGLGVLGVVAGVVGIRNKDLLGWLLAAASIGLAGAAIALAAVA
jgi:hypothetical protein